MRPYNSFLFFFLSCFTTFSSRLNTGAVSFILCHNHPSGDTNPSQEDIQITESIGKAGSLIGVSLLDHLIIGEKNYTSLREIQAVTFE